MNVTPAIDIGAIATAIQPRRAAARRTWGSWRIAASIALLAVGGTSIAIMKRTPELAPASKGVLDVPVRAAPVAPVVARIDSPGTPAQVAEKTPQRQVTPVVPAPSRVVGESHELHVADGSLGELSEAELTSLLRDIEALDALPSTDVESPAIAPIAPGRRGGA